MKSCEGGRVFLRVQELIMCVSRWPSGMVPDLRSVGRGFESQPPRCRVQVVNTHVPVNKQYNLVPANGRRRITAGKITVGLASHWPRVRDISVVLHLRTQCLGEGDEHPPMLSWEHG